MDGKGSDDVVRLNLRLSFACGVRAWKHLRHGHVYLALAVHKFYT
jgi:hypothetical protein